MKLMMKRWLCALLTMVLALSLGAASADLTRWTDGEFWLQNWSLVPQQDGSLLLHLMLGKKGGAVSVDNVVVMFYDEAGENIPVLSVDMHAAPVLTLPEGLHYFPMTLRVVPEAGRVIADVRVKEIHASYPQGDAPVMPRDSVPGHFMMKTERGDELTAFMTAFAGDDPTAYTGFAFILDADGRYLGNIELPRGAASFVPGEALLGTLAVNLNTTEVKLLRMGFEKENPDCVLFTHIPMTGLPEGAVPGSAYVFIYAFPVQPARYLEIVGFTLETEEGGFRIQALAQNVSDEPVELTGVSYVMLQDASGDVRMCGDVTLEAPFRTAEPGEQLPFVLTGALEPGFEPAACGFDTACVTAAAPDHEKLIGLAAPQDGDVSGCIVLTVCLDERTGELYGLEWSQPGQASVADGRILLPEAALLDTVPDGARVRQTFYRLLPAESTK